MQKYIGNNNPFFLTHVKTKTYSSLMYIVANATQKSTEETIMH